jgi:peroxiredoxin Q/BCP
MSLFSLLFGFAKADPLKEGDAAPAVGGVNEAGVTINLGDVYKKQPYTLVYFYPKADTPGCTAQGCSLRDGNEALAKRGVAIVGVSADTVDAQKAFKEKYSFPFTLIADTDKKVIKAFGQTGAGLAKREAYLIKDGKIVFKDVGVTSKQADEVIAYLDSHKT